MGLETNKVKYKDSWHLVRLKELCTRISDGTHFTPEYVNTGIPFISVKDIYDEKVHFDKCRYITTEAHQELIKRCFPEKNDVLITKSGTIGRMALVPDNPQFSLFVSVALLKNKKDLIHSKFLKYCLENFLNHINISQDIKGGLLKNFHLEDIRETIIPVVTLEEQQAIVTKIEELFSHLENSKQQLQTAQHQLKVYRQSLLKWAFEGKLTNKNVKDGELPEGWKWVTIEEIGIIKGGKRLPPKHQYSENPTPYVYIMAGNLKDGTVKNKPTYIKEETYNVLQNYKVIGGEVYITIVGACIGDAGVIPENIAKSILTENAAKIIDLKNTQNKFLAFWINSLNCQLQIKRKILSATLGKLALNRIGKLEIPLPPLSEQQLIVNELESKLTICDKIEENISQSLQQAEALRQSILKRAFEGRLV